MTGDVLQLFQSSRVDGKTAKMQRITGKFHSLHALQESLKTAKYTAFKIFTRKLGHLWPTIRTYTPPLSSNTMDLSNNFYLGTRRGRASTGLDPFRWLSKKVRILTVTGTDLCRCSPPPRTQVKILQKVYCVSSQISDKWLCTKETMLMPPA